ncbi:NADPH-dependent 7-cyano-7-deazaguanine reductase QueF [candidate division KSB1 bacterium]|nr:NADPH-dependent 7-cyano-7-deazaguanine reductase QueF [candidate division KSB1 bacterium]
MDEIKRGQLEIMQSRLEVFDNKYPHRDYEIVITNSEFTCLCPKTGYPDFAVITVRYIPDKYCIELKSFKLFINKFRDRGIFHEEAVNEILEALVAVCKPRYMQIQGDFNPRGNVHTFVTAEYSAKGFKRSTLSLQSDR